MNLIKTAVSTAKAKRQDDEGFTLVELAIVVMIIGILLTLAIPMYLGVKQKAEDAVAKAHVRTFLAEAMTSGADHDDSFSWLNNITTSWWADQEGGMLATQDWAANFPAKSHFQNNGTPHDLLVYNYFSPTNGNVTTFTTFTVVAESSSGKCFYLRNVSGVITKGWRNASAGACNIPLNTDGYPTTGIAGPW
jgi:prepilin-type N-terminal cleavage/methylation domain-containing protein